MEKIGLGGGCHWCTEAVFQALVGVARVEQGWISSESPNDLLSEAVIVHYDDSRIDLDTLIKIHLYTHSCTALHSMRHKYRSAVYTFDACQTIRIQAILESVQSEFTKPIITQILPFKSFRPNIDKYNNYYQKHAENQFCQAYINPKLRLLMKRFAHHVSSDFLDDKPYG